MTATLHRAIPVTTDFTSAAQAALAHVYGQVDAKAYGFLNQLTFPMDPRLEAFAETWRRTYDTFVILGTGGSNLGAKAYYEAQGPVSLHADTPQFYFMDNVDPHSFDLLFQKINLNRTGFLVISKSGTTAETLCQFLHVIQHYDTHATTPWQDHVAIITEDKPSPLKELARLHNLPTFDHPLDVGGRFSAFSVVGLLPAMLMGLSVDAIRDGALWALNHLRTDSDFMDLLAYRHALTQEHGITQMVLMPYVDRLQAFTAWHRQLWAESLGKQGQGTTPIPALGTVDQHSQLQLYLEGPKDKFFTIITVTPPRRPALPVTFTQGALSYLNGKHMGDLLEAETHATIKSLQNNGCPTCTLTCSGLDEKILAILMVRSIIDVLATAHMMGVDAFSQPAVEESKQLTRLYLQEGQAA